MTESRTGFGALERLKSDTHLAILCGFATVGSLALGLFAVFRLTQGQVSEAVADGLLVASIVGGFAYAWKTGRSVMAGNLIAILLTAGALFMIPVRGLSYMWLFSLMISIFLMANNRVGIVLSMLLVGVIGSTPELFADRVEQATFIAVAVQVAVFSFVFAWRTSRQHRQLDVMANRDPLTGIGNRRALRREIAIHAEAARMRGEPAGLAVIDLDHFKDVNDAHGHDAGDKVLVDLAGIVSDTMRAADSFYRYGGEEFVLIMPGTAPEGIAPALDKLQGAIRERLHGPGGPVTVSIGAAGLDADDDPGQWLTRADRALYAAKAAGRDRFCVDYD
ncbi:MAG: diguanylate cyclase [Woeseiaceae bacterium]|nr:diguanylate cyclase [Woeseiaceae bacterium]